MAAKASGLAHLLLRPIGNRINQLPFQKEESDLLTYVLKAKCKEDVENRIRELIVETIRDDDHLKLRALKSSDNGAPSVAHIEAEILSTGNHDNVLEKARGQKQMPTQSQVDFFQYLPKKSQAEILPFLSKSVRESILRLSAYPPDTAGGIISLDYATVFESMTCAEAIAKVRQDAPSKKMIYCICVVNDEQRLFGFVTLHRTAHRARQLEMRARFFKLQALRQNFAFGIVPFLDLGRVWDRISDFGFSDYRWNYGMGARIA